MKAFLVLMCLCGPVIAQEAPVCPAAPDHAAEKVALLRELRIARDETDAMLITGDLWRIWTDAPDPMAQEMLDRGMAQMRSFEYGSAIATLGELVAYCPDYAEGWNQRAFAAFLSGDFALALEDLERALAIDPKHVAALSGKALTLMKVGRDDEAQLVLRDAVHMNPWLGERRLLTIPLGQDI